MEKNHLMLRLKCARGRLLLTFICMDTTGYILQRRTRGRKWKKTLHRYSTKSENYIDYYIQVAKTNSTKAENSYN